MNVASTPTLAELQDVVELAERAGRTILDVYGREGTTVTLKDDRSPLTEADEASHRMIMDELRRLRVHGEHRAGAGR